jgi:serine/threonine protein kinase
VKIADFGISKRIEPTTLRTRVGTEAYLAPEVRGIYTPADLELREGDDDETLSLAVDIWAVGAIAFRAITGRLAFQNGPELYRYVVSGTPFPVNDTMGSDCTNFVAETMSPSPRQRPTAEQALARPWMQMQPSNLPIPDLQSEGDSNWSDFNLHDRGGITPLLDNTATTTSAIWTTSSSIPVTDYKSSARHMSRTPVCNDKLSALQ